MRRRTGRASSQQGPAVNHDGVDGGAWLVREIWALTLVSGERIPNLDLTFGIQHHERCASANFSDVQLRGLAEARTATRTRALRRLPRAIAERYPSRISGHESRLIAHPDQGGGRRISP